VSKSTYKLYESYCDSCLGEKERVERERREKERRETKGWIEEKKDKEKIDRRGKEEKERH
jgi:hypothetical protein